MTQTQPVSEAADDRALVTPAGHYPLFKGATRVPTVPGGVPTRAFAAIVVATVVAAMIIPIWGWLLFPILYPIVAILSREDDRAFWIWELWLRTKFSAPNQAYWGAVSYTPMPYVKRRIAPRLLGILDDDSNHSNAAR